MFIPASPISVLFFEMIVVVVIFAVLAATKHAYRENPARARQLAIRVFVVLVVWLGTMAALITSGKMESLPLQGFPVFVGSVLLISIGAALAPFGRKLAAHTPLIALVAFQAFRLPLELVLHYWARRGTIPTAMTWSGQNWDVIAGALAFVIWPVAGKYRAIAWIFNLIGLSLLINVLRVALMSSTAPFGWALSPPLQLWLHVPYFMIGPVLVGGAIFGHLVLTRALLRKS